MFPGRLHLVWLLLSCLALASCGERGTFDQGRRSDRKLGPGEACSVDLECGEQLRCEPGRRVCVCTSDQACPLYQTCDPFTGLCVREALGCGPSNACQKGQWCDTQERTCRPIKNFCEPCEDDRECGEEICLQVGNEKFCSLRCETSNQCPWSSARVSCVEGSCQPEISCAASAPCVADRGNRCSTDRDCPSHAGQRCDTERSVCVAVRSGCLVGEVCDPDTLVCRSPCHSNDVCPRGESCRGCERGGENCQGVCAPIPTCDIQDPHCPGQLVCRLEPGATEGICIAPCSENQDCPMGEICTWQGSKRVCMPGCATHADCALHQICDSVTETCVEAEGRCQIAATCGTCELCDGGNRCVPATGEGHCAPCGGDDRCGGGLCEAGRCLLPCGEKGCPAGFGCVPRWTGNGVIRVCAPTGTDCPTACG